MRDRTVKAFFYGSFIRKDVQAKAGFVPSAVEVARLSGFEIHVSPHAALSQSDQHSVYGLLVDITHRQLELLYSAPGVGVFLPQAVLVETRDAKLIPALCYIPPAPEGKPADRDYLNQLVTAARGYGFPDWYLAKLSELP